MWRLFDSSQDTLATLKHSWWSWNRSRILRNPQTTQNNSHCLYVTNSKCFLINWTYYSNSSEHSNALFVDLQNEYTLAKAKRNILRSYSRVLVLCIVNQVSRRYIQMMWCTWYTVLFLLFLLSHSRFAFWVFFLLNIYVPLLAVNFFYICESPWDSNPGPGATCDYMQTCS